MRRVGGALAGNPLHPLFIRVVPSQYHGRVEAGDPRVRERGGDRGPRGRLIYYMLGWWERRRLLDHAAKMLEPPGLVEGHGRHYPPVFAIGRDKASIVQRALHDHNLLR